MPRRSATALIGVLCASLVLAGAAAAHPRPLDGLLLPNLQMAPLDEWVIEQVDGRRMLRFTTIFINVGEGSLELRGFRAHPEDPEMLLDQVIYRRGGGVVRLPGATSARYAGDGHDHWHAQAVTTYELWSDDHPAEVRRGAKINFCFFDNILERRDLASTLAPFYRITWCGTPEVRRIRVGLSPGWGDRYGWDFAYQWIEIDGLAAGSYMVRATVDQQGRFTEANNVDNCAWARIRIPAPGGDDRVEVLEQGEDCGVASALPVATFPGMVRFDAPRSLALAAGRHTGALLNGIGTILDERSYTLLRGIEVTVDRIARPVGQPGDWVYVSAGLLRGTWLRLGPGVSLAP